MDVKEQKVRDTYWALARAVGANIPTSVQMYPRAVELGAIDRLAQLLSTDAGQQLVKALAEGAPAALPAVDATGPVEGGIQKQWHNEPRPAVDVAEREPAAV